MTHEPSHQWPAGSSEMSVRIRTHEWAATPLGPMTAWPQSLRSVVDVLLPSGFPMVALWGPELIQIYNDRYCALMGRKHPAGLGQATRDCWPEVWHLNAPIYQRVLAGETLVLEDARYPITRDGALEDAWFTLSYSPLRDEPGTIVGVLVTLLETTERKVSEAKQAYILKLSDVLRSISDPVEIQAAVTLAAMQHFNTDRCYYCEIIAGKAIIQRDSARGDRPSVAGEYPLSDMPIFKAVVDAGRPFVVQDAHTTELLDELLRGLCIQLQIISFIDVPVIKGGRPVGVLCITQSVPRAWTAAEVELAVETAERTWAAVERARAEAALRDSEARHRTLFDSVDEGVCLFERLPGHPDGRRDYRYLAMNPAMQAMFGTADLSGQSIRDNFPDEAEAWYDEYDRVLETGQSIRFERESEHQGMVLEMFVTRVEDGSKQRLLAVMQDVTERKRDAKRQEFLLAFSDILRAETHADALANRAIRMLYEHLRLDRCYIGVYRLADDRGDFTHQVGNDRVPPLPDGVRLSDFPDALRTAFDRTLVIDDVAETAGLTDTDRRNLGALGLRALIVATLRKGDNNPLWSIVAVSAHPRSWTPGEVALVEEATERTWAAIERVHAEAALREREERYRTLFETMGQGYCDLELLRDTDGRPVDQRYLQLNPAFERIFGIPVAQAQGRRASEVFPALEPWWHESFDRIARAGKPERIEHEVGSLGHWYEVWVYPRGGDRLTVLYEDISERRRVEQAMRESEERLRTLADAVPQVIWANDAAGKAIYFNQRWYDYSGLSQEESLGLGWQAIVHPDDAPASVERWQRALAAGAVFDTEYRLRRSDGVYCWFIGRNVPLRDDGDQVVGWFGSATDIEDLKQAVQRAREELEARVQERTAELVQLSQARQELLERLVSSQEDERRRIARELHDSLGQLLTAFNLRLSLVQRREDTVPAVADELGQLRALVQQLEAEVDHLTTQLRPPALEHLGLVEALASYTREWTRTTGIPIELYAQRMEGQRLPPALESTAYRVVQEALTNVVKHAQATQVSIIVERRPALLSVIVEDDGIGFDVEALAAGAAGGRHVGLVGIRERAALAGGEAVIESAPGAGTSVYLRIPIPHERHRETEAEAADSSI